MLGACASAGVAESCDPSGAFGVEYVATSSREPIRSHHLAFPMSVGVCEVRVRLRSAMFELRVGQPGRWMVIVHPRSV